MLKPENVVTKAPGPRPAPTPDPKAVPEPPGDRCALCGEPCSVVTMVMEPGWQVQECGCSGRQRRKADVADGRLTPDAR